MPVLSADIGPTHPGPLLARASDIGGGEGIAFEQQGFAGPLCQSIRCAVAEVKSGGVAALSKAPKCRRGDKQLFLIEWHGLNVDAPPAPLQNHRRVQYGNG